MTTSSTSSVPSADKSNAVANTNVLQSNHSEKVPKSPNSDPNYKQKVVPREIARKTNLEEEYCLSKVVALQKVLCDELMQLLISNN